MFNMKKFKRLNISEEVKFVLFVLISFYLIVVTLGFLANRLGKLFFH